MALRHWLGKNPQKKLGGSVIAVSWHLTSWFLLRALSLQSPHSKLNQINHPHFWPLESDNITMPLKYLLSFMKTGSWHSLAPGELCSHGRPASLVKCLGVAIEDISRDADQCFTIRLTGESPEPYRKFPLWDRLVNSWPQSPRSLQEKLRVNDIFTKPTRHEESIDSFTS